MGDDKGIFLPSVQSFYTLYRDAWKLWCSQWVPIEHRALKWIWASVCSLEIALNLPCFRVSVWSWIHIFKADLKFWLFFRYTLINLQFKQKSHLPKKTVFVIMVWIMSRHKTKLCWCFFLILHQGMQIRIFFLFIIPWSQQIRTAFEFGSGECETQQHFSLL